MTALMSAATALDKAMARTAEREDQGEDKREGRWLAAAVVEAPRLVAPQGRARAPVPNGSREIGRSAAGKALKRLVADAPKLEALLAGLAEGSPFLWELATAEPDRLLARARRPIPTSTWPDAAGEGRARPSPPPRTKPRRCGCCAA